MILGPIPDLVLVEDSAPRAVDLSPFAFDRDTPASGLRWNLTGYAPSLFTVSGLNLPENHVLTFVPRPDAWGNARVTYWLMDRDGNGATAQAWVNVTPVNDRPRFDPPATLIVRYDSPYVFDYGPYISDVDTPRALLTLTSDDPVRAAVSGFNVTYRYPKSLLNQWVFVTLSVNDGALFAAKIVAVKVTSDNPPVVTRPLPDLTLDEGEFRAGVFDLDDYFTDPDNDALFYSFGYSHLNITIHGNHSVDVQADAEWSGQEQVTFRGTDGTGAIAEDTIIVTVLPVDDPPVLGPVPDLRVRFDAPYTFNLEPYVDDPDTPIDGITVATSSAYISVSARLLTLLYPAALNGTVEAVTIRVSDGTSTAMRTINVTVSWERPPDLLVKMPNVQFLEDTVLPGAYDLSRYFEDPDSATLFYSSGNRSVLVTILPSGIVDLAATRDWFGIERITFRATDPEGGLAEDTVTVTVSPVNDAPAFLPIPVQETRVTAFFLDLTEYVVDVDNRPDELTLVTVSSEARIVGRGILFNVTRDGDHAVEVFVSDGLLTNSTTILVRVSLAVTTEEVIPGYFWWILPAAVAAGFVSFVVYRRRQLEWAFLVNRAGLLISSVARKEATVLDTDLLTGMLTAIMDFAHTSFSDENERNLEGLELGDKHVAIARGDACYLAVVYRGRAPGSLTRIMRGLVEHVDANYGNRIQDVIEPAELVALPELLNRLLRHGWWPLLSFEESSTPARAK